MIETRKHTGREMRSSACTIAYPGTRKLTSASGKKDKSSRQHSFFFTLAFLMAGAAMGLLVAIFGSKKKQKTAQGSDGRALTDETFLAFTRPHLASKNKNPQGGITSPFDH